MHGRRPVGDEVACRRRTGGRSRRRGRSRTRLSRARRGPTRWTGRPRSVAAIVVPTLVVAPARGLRRARDGLGLRDDDGVLAGAPGPGDRRLQLRELCLRGLELLRQIGGMSAVGRDLRLRRLERGRQLGALGGRAPATGPRGRPTVPARWSGVPGYASTDTGATDSGADAAVQAAAARIDPNPRSNAAMTPTVVMTRRSWCRGDGHGAGTSERDVENVGRFLRLAQ